MARKKPGWKLPPFIDGLKVSHACATTDHSTHEGYHRAIGTAAHYPSGPHDHATADDHDQHVDVNDEHVDHQQYDVDNVIHFDDQHDLDFKQFDDIDQFNKHQHNEHVNDVLNIDKYDQQQHDDHNGCAVVFARLRCL